MIISASYRTDIPAFYGEWFRARLRAGYVRVRNPYGGRPAFIPLDPGHVDGFVFWTRNPAPFMDSLREIQEMGKPFIIQFTLTGALRTLDRFVPDADRMISVFCRLAEEFGPAAVVWRYDPVVWTSEMPSSFHRTNFARLADKLAGFADEVVFSFVHPYAKTKRNMNITSAQAGITWRDPQDSEKRELLTLLATDAESAGFQPTLCAQPHLLAPPLMPARCIDAARLSRVAATFGALSVEMRERGNRPGCLCHESRDIGAYETCPHGCVYCYAVTDTRRAVRNYRQHNVEAQSLE